MTRGVPRLKEVFKVTKSPKATSLSIFLKPEFRESKEKAREVAQDLELTMLRDIVTTLGLYYDPKDSDTIVPEDRDLLTFYRLFEQRQLTEGAGTESGSGSGSGPGPGTGPDSGPGPGSAPGGLGAITKPGVGTVPTVLNPIGLSGLYSI
jgi:hypothetical protein